MRMTIGSVMDDINEWQGPNGAVYYVTAFFTNSEMLSCGKKDMDAALEVKGLLQEVIEVPQEFILEPKGQTKKGAAKWNLKAFGPPEGVWTYSTIKGGQPEVGAGEQTPVTSGAAVPTVAGSGAPAPTNNVDASIRASVALKAAASMPHATAAGVLETANEFDAWLAKKSVGAGSESEGTQVPPQVSAASRVGKPAPEPPRPAPTNQSSGVTPQGSPEETGVEPGTGEGLGSTPTKWQERVETWPKD